MRRMQDRDIERIAAWLVEQGLAGVSEHALLQGFAEQCRAAGLDLGRALALIDTLHPVYEGRAFFWDSAGLDNRTLLEYGPTSEGEAAAEWQRTTFYHLLESGGSELRRRFCDGDPADFAHLDVIREAGQTEYIALLHRFPGDNNIGEMDCFYSHWTTGCENGFCDADLEALRRLVPSLALAIKCTSLARVAGTLVEVYLGRDAGRRVLAGRIARGVADRIRAVLWFSDLRGFTTITDTASPDEIIPLLNDYAEAVITAVHEAGGDVLKLVGDGTLAIFKDDRSGAGCRRALAAETDLRRRIAALNARRSAEGRPVTSVYLGLHVGDVFYGNIGSNDRLDFTVVGPAVNEVSRISSMCRSVDQGVLISAEFAAEIPADLRERIVSVGRYALRGVGRVQDLFTLDPTRRQPDAAGD
jgi:adenylate cyclase